MCRELLSDGQQQEGHAGPILIDAPLADVQLMLDHIFFPHKDLTITSTLQAMHLTVSIVATCIKWSVPAQLLGHPDMFSVALGLRNGLMKMLSTVAHLCNGRNASRAHVGAHPW